MAEPKKAAFNPDNIKVVKTVTLPLLKWTPDETRYLTILAPMFKGKELKGTGEKAKMEPATLINVRDLMTGNEAQVIAGEVLKGNLDEAYPKNGYVGKSFAITQHKVEGKRYRTWTIAEIEA